MRVGTQRKRFNESVGERYMADGVTIRCQSVTKTAMRKERERRSALFINKDFSEVRVGDKFIYDDQEWYYKSHQDNMFTLEASGEELEVSLTVEEIEEYLPEVNSDEIWPEGQCSRSATTGKYGCKLHGGGKEGQGITLEDALPLDMLRIYKGVRDNPDLLTRYEEMALLQTRNISLWEDLSDYAGESSLAAVREGIALVESGSITAGVEVLKRALNAGDNIQEGVEEFRKNTEQIRKLHETQLKTEQAMQQFITREQLFGLVQSIFKIVTSLAKDYIPDENTQRGFISEFAARIRLTMGPSSKDPSRQIRG